MHPAPSIILFTTLSGLGLGLLTWLGLDPSPPTGWMALAFFAIGFALAGGGLAASAFHLGRPERALKAFTQWRSSWLSREAWAASAALALSGLHAAALVFAGVHVVPLGWLAALLALTTVGATAMIYTQLKTVPAWHHWSTPALFLALSLTGGALLSGRVTEALVLLLVSGTGQAAWWWAADRRMHASTTNLQTATGLTHGAVRPFEPPHTGGNYLTREMGFAVARKHAQKLRGIALLLGFVLPAALLALAPGHVTGALALLGHVAGVATSRWLFFAEARHVVSLYYPQRAPA